MRDEDVKKIKEYLDSVKYQAKLFTIGFDKEKYIFGAVLKDQPEFQKLFSYNTIYESIVDIDKKVKYSITMATKFVETFVDDEWNPFDEPSKDEWKAIYYTENAFYRVSMLWDLLAQLFNIKENLGISNDKIYAEQLFHNAQQGKNHNSFAKKVYDYMKENDDYSTDSLKGNYAFQKEYRDKMSHRYSPGISTISNYAIDIRMPAIYSLYRITADYKQVSMFIQELIGSIIDTVDNNANSEDPDNA